MGTGFITLRADRRGHQYSPEGDPDGKITNRQRAFVEAYARGETKQSALRNAGFAPSVAANGHFCNTLLQKPKIQKLLAEERRKFAEENKMTRQAVMEGLQEAIAMAKLVNEPAAMISGWREIGKLCGFYEPTTHKVEVSVNGAVMLERMNSMTDEELLAVIQKGTETAIEVIEYQASVEDGEEGDGDEAEGDE